jgi:hypothetical protein
LEEKFYINPSDYYYITTNYTVVSNPKSKSFFRHLLFKSYEKKVPALLSSLVEVGKLRPKKE